MKKNNNKQVRRQRTTAVREIPHPPQLQSAQLVHSATLRYRAGVATSANATFTFQNLLDSYPVATTAIAGVQLFQVVRIRRVRLWAIPAVGSSFAASVEFTGVTAGNVGDQRIHTDTSMGVQPAHIDCRPSARSLASAFQLSSSASAFQVTAVGTGAVVLDVEVSFRQQFAGTPVSLANALAGATAGATYLRGLDGLATGATAWVPEYAIAQI